MQNSGSQRYYGELRVGGPNCCMQVVALKFLWKEDNRHYTWLKSGVLRHLDRGLKKQSSDFTSKCVWHSQLIILWWLVLCLYISVLHIFSEVIWLNTKYYLKMQDLLQLFFYVVLLITLDLTSVLISLVERVETVSVKHIWTTTNWK